MLRGRQYEQNEQRHDRSNDSSAGYSLLLSRFRGHVVPKLLALHRLYGDNITSSIVYIQHAQTNGTPNNRLHHVSLHPFIHSIHSYCLETKIMLFSTTGLSVLFGNPRKGSAGLYAVTSNTTLSALTGNGMIHFIPIGLAA